MTELKSEAPKKILSLPSATAKKVEAKVAEYVPAVAIPEPVVDGHGIGFGFLPPKPADASAKAVRAWNMGKPGSVIVPEAKIPVPQPEKPSPKRKALPDRIWPSTIAALMERVQYRQERFENTVLCHGLLDGKFLLGTGMYATVAGKNFDEETGCAKALAEAAQLSEKALWKYEGYRLYGARRLAKSKQI